MRGVGRLSNISSFFSTLTALVLNFSFWAACIIPYTEVPSKSVPAASLIFDTESFNPYCFDIVAKHAGPQS
jgi:hypothetical protein